MGENENRKWDAGEVTLNTSTLPEDWKVLVEAAANEWNGAGANFEFKVGGGQNAINVTDHGRSRGALAYTVTRPRSGPGSLTYSRTSINTWYEFDPPHPYEDHGAKKGAYDLLSLLVHELGHHLWLGHSRERSAVMWRSLRPGEERQQLHPDDVATIQELYP